MVTSEHNDSHHDAFKLPLNDDNLTPLINGFKIVNEQKAILGDVYVKDKERVTAPLTKCNNLLALIQKKDNMHPEYVIQKVACNAIPLDGSLF